MPHFVTLQTVNVYPSAQNLIFYFKRYHLTLYSSGGIMVFVLWEFVSLSDSSLVWTKLVWVLPFITLGIDLLHDIQSITASERHVALFMQGDNSVLVLSSYCLSALQAGLIA